MNTATAHNYWDLQWKNPEARKDWETLDPRVEETLESLLTNRSGKLRGLDIGMGAGRHLLTLARKGFLAAGCDMSPASLELVEEKLQERHLDADLRLAPMGSLPWERGSFDYVLAWNVIYHGTREDLLGALGEIHRVLIPGGIAQLTLLSQRHRSFGKGDSLDPWTWTDPSEGDKAHPHCYLTREDLERDLGPWKVIRLEEYIQEEKPETWHWHLVLQKK